MKREINKLSWLGLLLVLIIPLQAFPQSEEGKKPKKKPQDCAGNCFSAEILNAVRGDDGCTDYEMRVSHDGDCRYELSHFTVDIPCGEVSNVSNSGGWAQVVGKDPTTGLTGLKIDDIGDFGKSSTDFFTIKFTLCADSTCVSSCWQPLVAFKAATCVDYDTVSVACDSTSLQADVEKQNVSCPGNTDGSLLVIVEGGTAPYTYSWSTGCTSSSIHDLPTGTYTVTVADANGNTVTLTEEITGPSPITLSASTVNPTCVGNTNGAIDLTVEGGQAPYTYAWGNGATTQDLTNVAGGNYPVTVTDSAGCSSQATFQLINPVISVSSQTIQPACAQANGQIDITVSGGAGPYTFNWSNNTTSEDQLNLSAGAHSVVVTDANSCSIQASFFLRENNTLRITSSVTPTSCLDNGTGAIDITVSGGTTPYTYLWGNGSTSEDLTGLSVGIQKVTVTDDGGCTATSNIVVFRQTFQVASQVISPTCSGEANGSISLTPDGVPPYTYLWSGGQTTDSLGNLASGLYSVTITDNTGCSQLLSFFISDPVITTSASVSNLQCGAQGAFSIDLTVGGGNPPFSYEWSNGGTTEDISGLDSGTYNVTITDANGCTKSVDVVVESVVIDWSCLIDAPVQNPVCGSAGNALGTSVTDADSYSWNVQSDDGQWLISSGQDSPAIEFVAGGGGSATFTLAITKEGCTQTCSVTINSCSSIMTCGDDTSGRVPSLGLTSEANPIGDNFSSQNKSLESDFQLAVYPNPVIDQLHVGWTAEADEYVRLEIVDLRGKQIAELYSGFVREGESYRIEWVATELKDRLYIYRYSSATRTLFGKLLR